jgi:deoxyribonuclease-4
VVTHPGAHVQSGEEQGIARIAAALDVAFDRTSATPSLVALETTAGQGSNLGYRFEHLAQIIARCSFPERLAVCLDTCHVFAAGYPLAPKRKYNETMRAFERHVGFERLVAVHVNDSKAKFESRVDRHEHIGKGQIGLEAFRYLVNDGRFRSLPLYLETPKKDDPESGRAWDAINLEVLRGLRKRR